MKYDDIYNLFSQINNDSCTPLIEATTIKKKIIAYIKNNQYTKNSVDAYLENDRLVINFKYFNLSLKCKETLKLFSFPPVVASCMEFNFIYDEDKTTKTLDRFYLTNDGYITKDVFSTTTIVKSNNEYAGKAVFNELLSSLIREKLVVIENKLKD